MIFGIFALGTIGFWLLFLIASILLLVSVEYEHPGWATLSLIGTFALLATFGDFSIIGTIRTQPMLSLLALAGYFIAGTIWSLIKWWFFVSNKADAYRQLKASLYHRKGWPETYLMSKEDKENFHGREYSHEYALSLRPKASDNKQRIMSWLIYWPWSSVWTLINDPVKKLFKLIYKKIQKVFENISTHIYKDIDP